MLCGIGFNAAVPEHESVHRVMGYSGFEGLATAHNFAFIHDVYHSLSINNILEIYGALNRLNEAGTDWSDLILSRITNIKSQFEETIDPVLIGGYKLEIRAIYENRLASNRFINGRLTPNHAVMRDVANENAIMLERGATEPMEFLETSGLSTDEKRRVIFQGLIPAPIADRYIKKVESKEERRFLREVLDSSSG